MSDVAPISGEVKKPYQSKTLWTNLILAVLAFFPSVQQHVNSEVLATVFFAVNTVLRFTTKSGIGLK